MCFLYLTYLSKNYHILHFPTSIRFYLESQNTRILNLQGGASVGTVPARRPADGDAPTAESVATGPPPRAQAPNLLVGQTYFIPSLEMRRKFQSVLETLTDSSGFQCHVKDFLLAMPGEQQKRNNNFERRIANQQQQQLIFAPKNLFLQSHQKVSLYPVIYDQVYLDQKQQNSFWSAGEQQQFTTSNIDDHTFTTIFTSYRSDIHHLIFRNSPQSLPVRVTLSGIPFIDHLPHLNMVYLAAFFLVGSITPLSFTSWPARPPGPLLSVKRIS